MGCSAIGTGLGLLVGLAAAHSLSGLQHLDLWRRVWSVLCQVLCLFISSSAAIFVWKQALVCVLANSFPAKTSLLFRGLLRALKLRALLCLSCSVISKCGSSWTGAQLLPLGMGMVLTFGALLDASVANALQSFVFLFLF